MKTKSSVFSVAFSVALTVHVILFTIFLLIPKSSEEINKSYIQVHYIKETAHAAKSTSSAAPIKTLAPAMRGNATGAETKEKSDSASVLGTDLGMSVLYPRLSRMLGEHGKVIVEIQLSKNSSLSLPTIKTSSGFPRLDQSALKSTFDALERGLLSDFFSKKQIAHISFIFRLSGQ